MAKEKLEEVAIDRTLFYEKNRRLSERNIRKLTRNQEQFTRILEIVINLHNYMLDEKMTRVELAQKLGVSQAYICNLINGKLNPTVGTIEKYEKILGTSLLPRKYSSKEIQVLSTLPDVRVNHHKKSFNDSSVKNFNSLEYGYPIQFLAY